jgi:hypothetical protein
MIRIAVTAAACSKGRAVDSGNNSTPSVDGKRPAGPT